MTDATLPRYVVRTQSGVFLYETDDYMLAQMAAEDHAANALQNARLIDREDNSETVYQPPKS